MQATFFNAENDIVNEVIPKLRKNYIENKCNEGITDYPIIDFDEKDLKLLSEGVEETLKHSKIK